MTPIYVHEYTITSWNRNKMGVQQVVVNIVTETKDNQSLGLVEKVLDFIDKSDGINVSHKILLEGYRND